MSKRATESSEHDSGKRKRYEEGKADVPLNHIFQGEVASVKPYGAFIKIPGSRRQGLVHKSQMSKARIEDPSEMVATGEKVYCKVISLGDEGDKIGLSMKVVNQTSGQDMDPNNVEISLDGQKRKREWKHDRPKIELGAVLDTKCKKCGGHGHLSQDCFHVKGQDGYELIPELEEYNKSVADEIRKKSHSSKKKKKEKKEKKHKKEKRKKSKHRHSETDSDSDDNRREKHRKHKKKRHRRESSSSSG